MNASTDAQFLRGLAHDLSEEGSESDVSRLREIADRIENNEQIVKQWRAGHDDIGV